MESLTSLFMYIPGIIIFLVGSGQVRQWLRRKRADYCVEGSVLSCKHIVKKDKKNREIYNYYHVVVEYTDPQTKHTQQHTVKSLSEYAIGQPVRMHRYKGGTELEIDKSDGESLFHPWVVMLSGAFLILLVLEENQGREIQAMLCLAIVMTAAGANLIMNYVSLKRADLQSLDAAIIDIYIRQISKETKILRGSKYTYYPIVKYEINGKENIRLCKTNSSGENTFKVGEHMRLYYNRYTGTVQENHARKSAAAAGILLALLGILIGASILTTLI